MIGGGGGGEEDGGEEVEEFDKGEDLAEPNDR